MLDVPSNLNEYPIAIVLLLIFMAVVSYMLKRDDKYRQEQTSINNETLKTLITMQNELKNNWDQIKEGSDRSQEALSMTKDIANMTKDIAKVLSTIKCLK